MLPRDMPDWNKMKATNTLLQFADATAVTTPLLTVFAVDVSTEADANSPLPMLLVTADGLSDAAARFLTTGEFKATLDESLLLHAPVGIAADRLLIIGLGAAQTLGPDQVRKGAGTAIRIAKSKGLREIAIAFPEDRALSDEASETLACKATAQAVAEGMLLADFDPDVYKSDRKDLSLQSMTLFAPQSAEKMTRDDLQSGFHDGEILGRAQNFARSLVNEPGNVLTPLELGRRAESMCVEAGLSCEVHSSEKLTELGMGAFLAVAQGSAQPPALIVISYTPEIAPLPGSPIVALVGKGITFDTGGISIKPAEGMDKMKDDMAGAAAMIGAMQAIAELKPAVAVLCIVCSAENMPGSRAYRPGDVLTAMSGKTIEVMNTDAEGRLVLADGLHYAKTLGATHLIDAATLTGACMVALGKLNAGLFSNDEDACGQFQKAMRKAGEGFWRLPCTEEYRELIRSHIADIQNTGVDRYGGAITAAMFLKEFAGKTPWIHLDIAGQAWTEDARSYVAKGPSGFALRSIVEWVRLFELNV